MDLNTPCKKGDMVVITTNLCEHCSWRQINLRSQLVLPKDSLEPTKQTRVVYKVPRECGKVYVGRGREIYERKAKRTTTTIYG